MSNLSNKIDKVIEKINSSKEDPSQEVLDLVDALEEVSSNLEAVKKEKVKNVQTPFFAFPNMEAFSEKLDRLTKAVINSGSLSAQTTKTISNAIKDIKIEVPAPEVSVNVPDVKVPPIRIPEIKVPEQKVDFPNTFSVKEPTWLSKIVSLEPVVNQIKSLKDVISGFKLPRASKEAIAVRLSDGEKFYRAGGGSSFAATGGSFAQPLPDDPNTNGNSVLTYDGAGNLINIQKTIGDVTYSRDFTYDGSNNLITMTAWH